MFRSRPHGTHSQRNPHHPISCTKSVIAFAFEEIALRLDDKGGGGKHDPRGDEREWIQNAMYGVHCGKCSNGMGWVWITSQRRGFICCGVSRCNETQTNKNQMKWRMEGEAVAGEVLHCTILKWKSVESYNEDGRAIHCIKLAWKFCKKQCQFTKRKDKNNQQIKHMYFMKKKNQTLA